MANQIESVRQGLKIATAWAFLGLPGRSSKSCHSPFRDDARESFSVYQDKDGVDRWFDHALGRGGDVVDLWMAARGFLSTKDALADILRERPSLSAYQTPSSQQNAPNRAVATPEATPAIRWPVDLRLPLEAECRELGRLRTLPAGAFDLAKNLGTLKVATVAGAPSWIITDVNARCGEAKRFDGQPYVTAKGKKYKTRAMDNADKSWPVGLKTLRPEYDRLKRLLLVEGMPDYYAGLALAIASPIAFRVATMLGAGVRIGPDAAPLIRGLHVVIIPHNDSSGDQSIEAWVKQLFTLGAAKVLAQRLPYECNDLNDFFVHSSLDPAQLLKGFD
jgi:hypothetical protein